MEVCWPYFDPEFDNLEARLYGPSCRVCIDNESCKNCTVVKVDTVNKQGLLLRVVQTLTDMNLAISKSYISSDAEWFMDVFHVKDEHGKKLTDQRVVNHIQQNMQAIDARAPQQVHSRHDDVLTRKAAGADIKAETTTTSDHTAIEITGTDRPGLLSEISAALADLRCNVIEAHAWSHNECLACVAYISDQYSSRIDDPNRLASIKDHLSTVIHARTNSFDDHSSSNSEQRVVGTADLPGGDGMTNVEHRLHQLMLAGGDFEGASMSSRSSSSSSINGEDEGLKKTFVSIDNCNERGYSIVSVESKDRRRLMFDTVCTLTDMQYMIFHASLRSRGANAFQEYYIRRVDGYTLDTDAEKERVIKCLEAAIERRVCEGVQLEICAHNRVGLLSDITRVLRENGLAVVRADVATQGEKAMNAFYVRDVSGNEVNMEIVKSMKREISEPDLALEIKNDSPKPISSGVGRPRLSFSDMIRSKIEQFSHSLIPIK